VFSAVYWDHFLCCISLHLYVFCQFAVLVKLSVLAKRLAREARLSLRFNGHFPGEPGLAGVYCSKG